VSEEQDFAVVAAGGIGHLREVQALLAAVGLASELLRPPEGQGSP